MRLGRRTKLLLLSTYYVSSPELGINVSNNLRILEQLTTLIQ